MMSRRVAAVGVFVAVLVITAALAFLAGSWLLGLFFAVLAGVLGVGLLPLSLRRGAGRRRGRSRTVAARPRTTAAQASQRDAA